MVDTDSLQRSAHSTAGSARSSFARPGLVGRGLFYLLFGLLALDLAFGSSSSSSQGAVERVASAPFGRFLLIGLSVALVSLVVWKVLQAIAGDPVEGSEATDRAKYAAKALAYAGLAATSVTLLIANWDSSSSSSQSSGSGDSQEQATATVLDWPGGQWLVVIGGIAIIGLAVFELYKYAIEAEFLQRLDTMTLDESKRKGVEWSGRAGYAGKAAISAVIGVLLVAAGLQHDPDESEGLSGALRQLAESTWGTALLFFIGAGLFLFAAFSFIEAAYRRST
jgi:hypothetical protein